MKLEKEHRHLKCTVEIEVEIEAEIEAGTEAETEVETEVKTVAKIYQGAKTVVGNDLEVLVTEVVIKVVIEVPNENPDQIHRPDTIIVP